MSSNYDNGWDDAEESCEEKLKEKIKRLKRKINEEKIGDDMSIPQNIVASNIEYEIDKVFACQDKEVKEE